MDQCLGDTTPDEVLIPMQTDGSFLMSDDRVREPLLAASKRAMNTTSQTAIVGTKRCTIESLDYEVVENDLFKEDWRTKTRVQIFKYVCMKWSLALLVGLITGLVGFFNNFAVENIAGFKLLLTSNLMLKERYHAAFVAYVGCNLLLATVAAALCAYIAPAAAGSGIPEVKAYLNGVDSHSILAPGTLLVKIFGSIFGVSAGFVLGKEGPMVHTGACVASLLSQGGSRKYHLTWRSLQYIKNDRDRRDLITCGAAAGVAAAFRAPVGGVLFALEEATTWWRNALLWRTFFTNAVVAVVLRSLIVYCRGGKCGLFGKGGLIMFDMSSTVSTYSTADLLAVMILRKGAVFKIIHTMSISLLTSCCSYGIPWLARCTPCRSGNFKNFQCPPGHYNDLASLFLNTNEDAIRNLFSGNTGNEFDISTLILFFIAVYCLGLVTYGIAVPSGLFIPVILAGASFGRLVGTILGPISDLDPAIFALLGAASLLGGTMRMTVSVCVILLELTDDLLMLPLVMLVLLISKSVADNFNIGVYDLMIQMKGLPYLEAHAEPYMRHLVAHDVVSGPLLTFFGVEKVGNIIQILKTTGHHGFPVINEPPFSEAPELCGLVLRSHLIVLLKGKRFTKDKVLTGSTEVFKSFGSFDFAKAGPGKGMKLEELEISADEMEMYVDLHPITNKSPYTVVETMSLAKAALLFRELGLRHLFVVPKTPGKPPVVGILTRHDFMREHILGLFPHFNQRKKMNEEQT
ncbi:hypothetical protein J5N97_020124 [Dioscorea zingiberensis]|uniref:Chloride channel protein n=1 Tax=Dioscorea zingiberensis TaxID=325984 RepID=A0A9D5HDC8_9LILI|nr:hypothetical protein J5N97_020124 [Dioscorea zingiberensis]